MKKSLIIIFCVLYYGCESYNDRFHKKEDYSEKLSEYSYSDIRYYLIAGKKQRVQKTEYDDNDIIRKETFYRDEKPYRIRLYNEDGRILKEDTYKNIIQNGYRITYYSNGNINEEYDFINSDQKSGEFTSYYSNGGLQRDLEYLNGEPVGTCSWYYPSGNLMRIKDYLIDSNYQIEFYENGERKSEGSFQGDRLIGRWVFYESDGKLSSEEDYF